MAEIGPADLTVIIPTRDRWAILERTLAALRAQTVKGFDIVVVADGTDQNPPPLEARVVVKDHGGPGAARNAGVQATERRLILFLGDDMIPEPTLVERHLAHHRARPELNVSVLGHADWHPEVPDTALHRWLEWSGTQFDFHNIQGDDAGWGRFYSCNVSLKRDFFLNVGGFDEDFLFDYEDLDCGYRLNEQGLQLLYEPAAVAHHVHSYDWDRLQRRWESRARAERLMMAKHSWFSPHFANRIRRAAGARPVSRLWPTLADRMPRSLQGLQRRARVLADRWYLQQLAPRFLNAWAGETDLEELQAYLGHAYDESRLVDHQGVVEREQEAIGDEQAFYRASEAYLYDLTAFGMSPTKVPYIEVLKRLIRPGARVLDYGCGIGSDGLRLLDAGYRVDFADFDNPSTRYLRWRLERRGHSATVWDVDRGPVPTRYDAVYCFDVIEHVDDPVAFLAMLERTAAIVMVNFLEERADDTHLHRPLPIDDLVRYAAQFALLHYRVYHGRSHLIAYRTQRVRPLAGVRSQLHRLRGRPRNRP